MTLDEAIEIGEEIVRTRSFTRSKPPTDALKILIEAGKRIKGARGFGSFASTVTLHGETEE